MTRAASEVLQPNSALFKRVLALLRDGEYAHAGEEEAIRQALDPIRRDAGRRVLDAGCGLGGTAAYVQREGWGRVIGIDIDAATIAHAGEHHPEVEFHACDVVAVDRVIATRFDLVYAFNAVYAFPDQPGAFAALRRACAADGQLVVFDYLDRGEFEADRLVVGGIDVIPRPLHADRLPGVLAANGWRLHALEEVSADYERWYTDLCQRIATRTEAIRALGGDAAVHTAETVYGGMLERIRRGYLGGAIVRATAVEHAPS